MFQVKIKADDDILDAIQDTAKKSPGIMRTLTKRRFSRVKRKYLIRLREEPPELSATNYPLRWKSERQRRYVMMILEATDNLPYKRTHDLVNAWEMNLEITNDEASIDVQNNDPAVQFVQGDWQQPFHIDDGWNAAAPILVEAEEELNDGLIEDWYTASDPQAGVP